jgi:cytochrome bd-type quinol oxidase subunit 2
MLAAVLLFIVPTLIFVIAFLYETYVSFRRLAKPKGGKGGYLSATWEITHTLLVFAVVMLVTMFTQSLDELSSAIFVATFLAASALGVRAVLYIYLFYVRKTSKINWIDWVFAITHVIAALLLVVVVIQALQFIYQNNPPVNSQFLPLFIPGLVVVLLVVALPALYLYKTKN